MLTYYNILGTHMDIVTCCGVTTIWSPMVQPKLSRIYSLASIVHQDCFYGFGLGVILALMSVIEQEREDL